MDAATDPAEQWHVLPCVTPPARALAPNSKNAATGRCEVSSPTPVMLDASFVSMVANLSSTARERESQHSHLISTDVHRITVRSPASPLQGKGTTTNAKRLPTLTKHDNAKTR